MLYKIKIYKPYSQKQLAFINSKGQSWKSDDGEYYDRRFRSKYYQKSTIKFSAITLKQIQQILNSFKSKTK